MQRSTTTERDAAGLAEPPRAAPGAAARRAAGRWLGLIERMRIPLGPVEPYVDGETRLWREMLVPATVGFLAVAAIVWGASQPSSPFTWKSCHSLTPGSIDICHPWYFGIPQTPVVNGQVLPPSQNLYAGLVAVYGGMVVLMQAWIALIRVARRHPGSPVRAFVPVFVAWVIPLLVVAPLFSRDVYSYAAQGEMMSRGIDPYRYGMFVLGPNAFSGLVDNLWANVTSPYGPVFLWLGAVNATIVNHNELMAVAGFRLMALAGVVMVAVFLPRLARSYGHDGAQAFVLAALSPLVLLHLVAGAHNDAMMLGLLLAGLVVAREGRPVLGVLLCAASAMVKVPGFIGVVYIGWLWMGDAAPWRERVRPLAGACALALLSMAAVSEMVGLGWGWVSALGNPDTVRSWADPGRVLGDLGAKLVAVAGLGDHSATFVATTRDLGLLIASVIGVRLLWRAKGDAVVTAIGFTCLAVVVLGPTVQPWYLAWATVILAGAAEGRVRTTVIVISIVGSFLGLPGAIDLVTQFGESSPYLLAFSSFAIVFLLAIPVARRLRRAVGGTSSNEDRAALRI